MVIDFHNHIGRKKGLTFTDEDLLARMDASGVDRAVVFSFPENINNGFIQEACRRHPDRLTGFTTVNPWDENAEAELEACLDGGRMKGIKLHSLKHGFNFDNHLLLDPIFEIARKYKVPVIAYGAANVLCVSNMFEEMARTFPDVPLVMAHSGQMYEAKPAISAAARTKNLYLETSTVFAVNIQKQLADVGCERIVMGSDMPYGDYDLEMMKIRGEVSDAKALAAILGVNAQTLIGG